MKLILSLFAIMLNQNPETYVFDFSKGNLMGQNWYVLNDDVMGGVSTSSLDYNMDGYATFSGKVSLENNGGFASVRCATGIVKVQPKGKVILQLRGDGKRYQFRLRANKEDWYSYITYFETTGDWQEVEIDLAEMYPSFRGRKLDMGNFSEDRFEEISYLIANYKQESFQLDIKSMHLK